MSSFVCSFLKYYLSYFVLSRLLFNFQGPSRSPLSQRAWLLYHILFHLSIPFWYFFEKVFRFRSLSFLNGQLLSSNPLCDSVSLDGLAIIAHHFCFVNPFLRLFWIFFHICWKLAEKGFILFNNCAKLIFSWVLHRFSSSF